MEQVKGPERTAVKSKGGRPKKSVSKTAIIMIRLSPAERIIITNRAKIAGISASEWFRQAAKKAAVKARLSKEEVDYLRSLSGMANNFNQLVKLAHTQGLISLVTECRKHIQQIELLIEKLSDHDR
ncbi:plasmid mobilization protein [Edaphocola flava]|uniref:plasmid mobilization protein n=1 Tax=Edaphocola flava TaxID=2499629 RepID=UPI00100C135F|nr:plasmid mobilization relaxosome protein MobC [Edaphocola flava]